MKYHPLDINRSKFEISYVKTNLSISFRILLLASINPVDALSIIDTQFESNSK